MKTIIAGGRDFNDALLLSDTLAAVHNNLWDITEVVSGAAAGADRLGEAWAKQKGLPVTLFPAEWHKHGRAAGPIRNAEMAKYAEALVAFWDGKSRGTKNMIDNAKTSGLLVHVCRYYGAGQ